MSSSCCWKLSIVDILKCVDYLEHLLVIDVGLVFVPYRKNGFAKISTAHAVCLAVFLAIYITLDGAGTRPVEFCLIKGGVSFVCNFLLAIVITNILSPDDRK